MKRIVYAGLLGVAQDVLEIIEHTDFKSLAVELHLYGAGNQKERIEAYIATHPEAQVYFHGYVQADELRQVLGQYDAALIPLTTYIHGAVPSKIFDIIPLGLPILFCGDGEGAEIVNRYGLGFVSKPRDYEALADNLRKFTQMSEIEKQEMSERSRRAATRHFDYNRQMEACYNFILKVINDEKNI